MRSVRHYAGGVGAASMLNPALDLVVVCSVVIGGAGVNSCKWAWHPVEVRLVLVGMFVNVSKFEGMDSAWDLNQVVNG